jgi:hypothetical protein
MTEWVKMLSSKCWPKRFKVSLISTLANRETMLKLTTMSSDLTCRNSSTCTNLVDILRWYSKLRWLRCSRSFYGLTTIPATCQPLPLYPYITTLSHLLVVLLGLLDPWRQRHCSPLKQWEPLTWHSVTSQKTSMLSNIAVRTSNLARLKLFDNWMI